MSWALFAVIRNKCVYAAFHLQHCICHQHQYWSRIGKTLPDAKRTSSKFKSVLLDVEFNRCLVDFIKRGTRFSGLILLNTTVVHFCWSSNIQSKRPIRVLSVSVCYVFHFPTFVRDMKGLSSYQHALATPWTTDSTTPIDLSCLLFASYVLCMPLQFATLAC